jgi:hypothetical protein
LLSVLLLLVCITLPIVWVGALVDAASQPDEAFAAIRRTKAGWMVRLVFFGGVAGIYWFAVVRRGVIAAKATLEEQESSSRRSEPPEKAPWRKKDWEDPFRT